MSTTLVQPSVKNEPRTIRCTVTDSMLWFFAVPVVFFFGRKLDEASLIRALESALAALPPFAGRLKSVDGRLFVQCEGQGVPFTVGKSELTLADAIRAVTERRGEGLVATFDGPKSIRGRAPLLTVRLTHLADGTTSLGICWHHVIADFSSFMIFMKTWAAAAAGDTPPVPLVVEDRVAYLEEHLPAEGTRTAGYRKYGLGEFLNQLLYLAVDGRKKRPFAISFSDEELRRMGEAYRNGDVRLSVNDVLCAHLALVVGEVDPGVASRKLAILVDQRRRCDLDPSFIGNPLSFLRVDVEKADSASSMATRIRSRVDRFVHDSLDSRVNQRWGEKLGLRTLMRSGLDAIDVRQRDLILSNFCNRGIYDRSGPQASDHGGRQLRWSLRLLVLCILQTNRNW